MRTIRDVVVYDLNRTLYLRSSKSEFYKYIVRRKKNRFIYIIQMLITYVLHKLNLLKMDSYKENFYGYLNHIPPDEVQDLAMLFWTREFPKKFSQDLLQEIQELRAEGKLVFIITGSLEIYTRVLNRFIEVDGIMGTRTKYVNEIHEVTGNACKGKEKLRRLSEAMNNQPYHIIKAYSDDKEPILYIADEGYYVNGKKMKKLKQKDLLD